MCSTTVETCAARAESTRTYCVSLRPQPPAPTGTEAAMLAAIEELRARVVELERTVGEHERSPVHAGVTILTRLANLENDAQAAYATGDVIAAIRHLAEDAPDDVIKLAAITKHLLARS